MMPPIRGNRIYGEREQVWIEAPDPELRKHPLVTPQGVSDVYFLQDCRKCGLKHDCIKKQGAGLGFADPRCEMSLPEKPDNKISARLNMVLTHLQDYGPMTVMQLADALGRSKHQIRDIIEDLQNKNLVIVTHRIRDGQYRRNVYAVAPETDL